MEKTVETKNCKQCNIEFTISDKELEFYKKISPKFWWGVFEIPSPSLCPACRQQRRFLWRNEMNLYKRKCDITGKDMISIYSPDKEYKVYNRDYWRSDKWGALDYWMDYDFNKTFFEQYEELFKKVPKYNIEISPSENCDFTNQAWYNKNCYLIFEAWYNEDCFYSNLIRNSKNTYDCLHVDNLDNCYECIRSNDLYNVAFAIRTNNCKNSLYLYDCKNCEDCIWCWNLVWKRYYILNKDVWEKDYNIFRENFNNDLAFRKKFLIDFEKKKNSWIVCKNLNNLTSQNVIWDNIIESKNCSWYNLRWCENCYNSASLYNSRNSVDHEFWWNESDFVLNSVSVWNWAYKVFFSSSCYDNVDNIYYSSYCINNCSNLFWCVWLQNKKYCILNKQYTKEEYEKLVPKIISYMITSPQPSPTGEGVEQEWWEFFSGNIAPFWYNETIAQEYFPLSQKSAVKSWFKWSNYEAPFPKVEKIIPAQKLPDDIKDIPDDILNWAIECEVSKKPFKIILQELKFYRKHNLPIPKRHPNQRHLDRISLINPRKIYDRKCDKCWKDMKTTYSPEREEIVYCQNCYEKEVY